MTLDQIRAEAEALYPIISDEVTASSAVYNRRQGYILGRSKSLEGSAGVWCDCRENPPTEKGTYFVKDKIYGGGRMDYQPGSGWYWPMGGEVGADHLFLWLDESIPTANPCEADAVAFVEWLTENSWRSYFKGSHVKEVLGPEQKKTTTELYAIFKGQQQPSPDYRTALQETVKAMEKVLNDLRASLFIEVIESADNSKEAWDRVENFEQVKAAIAAINNAKELLK